MSPVTVQNGSFPAFVCCFLFVSLRGACCFQSPYRMDCCLYVFNNIVFCIFVLSLFILLLFNFLRGGTGCGKENWLGWAALSIETALIVHLSSSNMICSLILYSLVNENLHSRIPVESSCRRQLLTGGERSPTCLCSLCWLHPAPKNRSIFRTCSKGGVISLSTFYLANFSLY